MNDYTKNIITKRKKKENNRNENNNNNNANKRVNEKKYLRVSYLLNYLLNMHSPTRKIKRGKNRRISDNRTRSEAKCTICFCFF